jgi:hypothetical protein
MGGGGGRGFGAGPGNGPEIGGGVTGPRGGGAAFGAGPIGRQGGGGGSFGTAAGSGRRSNPGGQGADGTSTSANAQLEQRLDRLLDQLRRIEQRLAEEENRGSRRSPRE